MQTDVMSTRGVLLKQQQNIELMGVLRQKGISTVWVVITWHLSTWFEEQVNDHVEGAKAI